MGRHSKNGPLAGTSQGLSHLSPTQYRLRGASVGSRNLITLEDSAPPPSGARFRGRQRRLSARSCHTKFCENLACWEEGIRHESPWHRFLPLRMPVATWIPSRVLSSLAPRDPLPSPRGRARPASAAMVRGTPRPEAAEHCSETRSQLPAERRWRHVRRQKGKRRRLCVTNEPNNRGLPRQSHSGDLGKRILRL